MKWFEGSINEAVATSKSRKAVFVVFVEGKDDTSGQVAEVINAAEVSSRLEQEDFVAIRLESGSETYRFFVQIYQLVPVPSLFFIGENGIPLEIIAGSTTATDLVAKIDSVLTKAKKEKNSSINLINSEKEAAVISNADNNSNANPSVIEQNVEQKNDSTTKSNAEVILSDTPVENENKNVTINDTKVEPSTSMNTTTNIKPSNETKEASPKELTQEEKIKRAQQLIELQQKQYAEEKERREKERELERRRIGRDMQKMRQKQQDLEMKQAYEERLKEKAADAAAREKVRQQIAQDKLERKQKELALQQQMQKQDSQLPKPPVTVANDATVIRIQFRLPSGNPHLGQFAPTSTLQDLRTYVTQNIELPFRQFAISTSFPRRDLTHEEDHKTLLELQLVPAAVILILPLKNSNVAETVTTTQNVGFLSRIIWSLFSPVIGVYNYIMGYFSGGTRSEQNEQRRHDTSVENRDTANNADGTLIPNFQNVADTSGLVRRYLGNQGGTTIKTEGNIHRLHSGGNDNDENNTWNGNSTQQM